MSATQQPQMPDMNAMMQGITQQALANNIPAIIAAVTNSIGHQLRLAASQATANLDVSEFLTAPRRLNAQCKGASLVLVRRLRYGHGNLQLVVLPTKTDDGFDYQFVVTKFNEDDMTQSQIIGMNSEEQDELKRQMKALNVEIPMAFALIALQPNVENVDYFETEQDVKDRLAAADAEDRKTAVGDDAPETPAADQTLPASTGSAEPAASAPAANDDMPTAGSLG